MIKLIFSPRGIRRLELILGLSYLLNKHKKELRNKEALDIGCGTKPFKEIFRKNKIKYIGIDFKKHMTVKQMKQEEPDIFFDKKYEKTGKINEFRKETFDIIICTQVIEHIKDPNKVFKESERLLRKNGIIIISCPFIAELHGEPDDYLRFTHYKIQEYCKKNNLEIIERIKTGNRLTTLSYLLNVTITDSKLPKILKVILFGFIGMPIQLISYNASKYTNYYSEKTTFLDYIFLLKKQKA